MESKRQYHWCEVCNKPYFLSKTKQFLIYETSHPQCRQLAIRRHQLMGELQNIKETILELRMQKDVKISEYIG